MRPVLFMALAVLVSACVPQSDYDAVVSERDKVVAERDALLSEVDILKNGEDRLLAMAAAQFENDQREAYRNTIAKLKEWHPQSAALSQAEARLVELVERDSADREKAEAEAAERKRLANLNNTGIWNVGPYVDDFGEPTGKYLVRNTRKIRGRFSNTATQDSELDVLFYIDGPREVDLLLYEYARNNPVKAYRETKYIVQILDNEGERHRLVANNYGDRLSFGPQHSKRITDALTRGGTVKFALYEEDNRTSQYAFTIQRADYFENAMRLLAEK